MSVSMEDILNNVEAQITSNLETQLAAIESSRSVTIPRWKTLKTFYSRARQYPKIEIVPGDEDITYIDENAPLAEGVEIFDISIFITYAGTDDAEIGLVLQRYIEAMKAIFNAEQGNTLSGIVDWIYKTDVEWAPFVVALEDRRLEYGVRLGLQARKTA